MARLVGSAMLMMNKRKRVEEVVESPPERPTKKLTVVAATVITNSKTAAAAKRSTPKPPPTKPERYLTRPSRHPLAWESPKRKKYAFKTDDIMRVPSHYNNPISGLRARTQKEQRERRKSKFVANKQRDMHTQMILRSDYPQVRVKRERLIAVVDERVKNIENDIEKRSAEKSALVLKFMLEQSRILARSTWIRILLVNAYNFRKKESVFLSLDTAILSFMINLVTDLQTLRDSGIRMIHSRHILHLLNDVWPARWRAPVFRFMVDDDENNRRKTTKNSGAIGIEDEKEVQQEVDPENAPNEDAGDFIVERDKEGNIVEPSSEEEDDDVDDVEENESEHNDSEEDDSV